MATRADAELINMVSKRDEHIDGTRYVGWTDVWRAGVGRGTGAGFACSQWLFVLDGIHCLASMQACGSVVFFSSLLQPAGLDR